MAENNNYSSDNQRQTPNSSFPNHHGYHSAQNVNFGSNFHFVFGQPGSYNVSVDGVRQISSTDSNQTQAAGHYSTFCTGTSGVQSQSGFTFHPSYNSQPGANAAFGHGPSPNYLTPVSGGLTQHEINQPNYGINSQFALDTRNAATPPHTLINQQNHPQNNANIHLARAFFSAYGYNGFGGGFPRVDMPNQSLEQQQCRSQTNATIPMDDEDDDGSSSMTSMSSLSSISSQGSFRRPCVRIGGVGGAFVQNPNSQRNSTQGRTNRNGFQSN